MIYDLVRGIGQDRRKLADGALVLTQGVGIAKKCQAMTGGKHLDNTF
jgi:hypothetical protein